MHSLGIREYLDQSLNHYYIEFLNENGFDLTDSSISSIAGSYRFKKGDLNFDIVNDRGAIEMRLSSIFSDRFYDFELINIYLNRKNKPKPDKPKFGKSDLAKRLDLRQISELLKKYIVQPTEMFNEQNYKQTEKDLDKIGNELTDRLFGQLY